VDVVYVYGDDWAGVYFNDVLVYECHSVNWLYVMNKLVNKHILSFREFEVDGEWLEIEGGMPPDLKSVVLAK
jgi:hypothetical protein